MSDPFELLPMRRRDASPGSAAGRRALTAPRVRHLGLFAIGLLLAAGMVAACSSSDNVEQEQRITALEEQLEEQQTGAETLLQDKAELEEQLEDALSQRTSLDQELSGRIGDLEAQVEQLSQEAEAPDGVEVLAEIQGQLEADRLLLVEMRKDAPIDAEAQSEVETFWSNVKELAKRSDPSLPTKVSTVQRAIPNYFRFLKQDFSSDLELQLTYNLLAADYDNASDEFWSSFVLVLIGRIETLSRLAEGS